MYVSIPQNANFDDLPFDRDRSLITRRQINHINYDIVERLKICLIVYIYTNLI